MDPVPQLTLSVLQGPGEPVCVPVQAIAWGEVRAAFAAEAAPLLLIGQSVELGFRGPGIAGLARVRGFVAQRIEDDEARTYVFQLDHGDGTALDAAVNRRASIRVTPDPIAPVRVTLREGPDRPAVDALLRDISEGGLSVLVGREQEWLLARAERLEVQLRLPGEPGPLRLDARVRHRRLERTAIHYGMSFEGPAAGASDPHGAIRAFVAERGRAMQERLEPGDAA